ncbi:hypothetical protein KSX_04650 [Ktedonospora formicarum]|uniref:Uncharacterized protein n=1 Tax=Ktedonospora formicarum TaxID=2778364 RepID=A0A8J3HR42_9CHLR|nr:hypothetical protein KSX_04650 [Ktedonospora formicarum]
MTDWASIVSQVANIGVGLLTSLLGNTSGSAPQGYAQGDVVWSLDPKTNTVYAYNKSSRYSIWETID